jgi:hypothetical protein
MKPWATNHAFKLGNVSKFASFSHKHPFTTHWVNPFGVVSTELNTFRDIKDPSLDLIAFSHMGQSLRLRALATVVGSQSSSKCCDIWKKRHHLGLPTYGPIHFMSLQS